MNRRAISLRGDTYDRLTAYARKVAKDRGPLVEEWALEALERDEQSPEGVKERVKARTGLKAERKPTDKAPKPKSRRRPKIIKKAANRQPVSSDTFDGSGYHEL